MRAITSVVLVSVLALTGCNSTRTIYFENGRADMQMAYPPRSEKLLLPHEKQDIQGGISDGRFIGQIRKALDESKICSGRGGKSSSAQNREPRKVVGEGTVERGSHKIKLNYILSIQCNAA